MLPVSHLRRFGKLSTSYQLQVLPPFQFFDHTGVIVWGLDSHFSSMTSESNPPSTVGQGASRIDQSFSQIESAPPAVTAPAIKLEPSTGEATKTYDLEKKDQ